MQDAEYPSVALEHLAFWRERRMRARSEGEYKQLGMFVYVIQGKPDMPIKVGIAAKPLMRLRGLQTGNWETLRLLHVIPGDHQLEAAFHRKLSGARIQGEWFGGPEAEEFLDWVGGYCQRAVDGYLETRQLPLIPNFQPKRKRRPAPVTTRFAEPDPSISGEEKKRRMEAHYLRPARDDHLV